MEQTIETDLAGLKELVEAQMEDALLVIGWEEPDDEA